MDKPSTFIIHEDSRLQYTGFFVLKEIIEQNVIFSYDLEEDERALDPILSWLHTHDFVELNEHNEYVVTTKGYNHVHSFLARYESFLQEYDIFCGVDLKAKDFALCHYDKFQDAGEWDAFLNEERWEDLRVAVAEYKGFDAIEIIFMGFVHSKRFGRNQEGWHYELLLGKIWDEIQAICNTAVRLRTLPYHMDTQASSPEIFLQEIIDKGRAAMEKLSL